VTLSGKLIIGLSRIESTETFSGVEAASGRVIDPPFSAAGLDEIDRACALADIAAIPYASIDREQRARFLEQIAENIVAIGDRLIERAMAESSLPRARLEGERGRTVGQLRLFAAEVRDGAWLGLRIDPALPDRAPVPRPDLRLRNIPLGPVAVFGASNFPLAFSVAGGDTASALAAGCPVVVKGHPAHPGTSEMVGEAVAAAVQSCGLPEGVFSMVAGPSNSLGGALVADRRIKAVGFTGSRAGGLALMDIASKRPEPIPVYAEMSATNPVVLLPGALSASSVELANGFVASLTMGAGQFCTNPGLVFAVAGPDLEQFAAAAGTALGEVGPAVMLTPAIGQSYRTGLDRVGSHPDVARVGEGQSSDDPHRHPAALFRVSASTFSSNPTLAEEIFGASSIIVECADLAEIKQALAALEGQLTATIHFTETDFAAVKDLLPLLERKAGRILANGWPTGVEVSHAMVHGGPFPATSDGRSTSVGTAAIERFLRPVCYQNFPQNLLPDELADAGAQQLPRRMDGRHIV
jgi:alpha-ketoglutaric semialdehyde dehydrogenase